MPGTELVPAKEYAALQVPDTASLVEAIKQNIGTQQLTEFDLDRVKMPAGGGTTWEVPSLEGTDSIKELSGVIVFWKDTRAFWKEEYGGGNEPPDCSSPNAELATGDPGVAVPQENGFYVCARCPNAEFGSGKGNAQACKQVRQLFLLTPEDLLPLVVSLPPTSVNPAQKFFLRLARRGIPYHSVVTKMVLEKAKSGDGIDYSRATFAMAEQLEGEEAAKIQEYANELRPVFEREITLTAEEAGNGRSQSAPPEPQPAADPLEAS